MEQATVIAAAITGAFILLAALAAWAVGRRWPATPRQINQAAYEMAYRGMLHKMAGQRINSHGQIRNGKAWLSEATYLDKRSSRVGWNDAIDDIKEVLVASTDAVNPDMHWNASFLDEQIRARLQYRIGHRSVPQFRHTWYDAMLSAAHYQGIIRSQMRWQKMISNVSRFVGAIALLAVAVFLISSAPGTWSALEQLSPEILPAERVFYLKIIYSIVTAAFFGGGVGLLFTMSAWR